ncbi:hypothetical protein TWF225_002528 [Orbilia oligospora]|nr:hypothetical protein TWF751_004674 [Orbilia oligospora]KAF3190032.1 hypothetical protein TWF225_002528 [Orbilia oligospora]KAF3266229.1 hypothetical protein TWF217_001906 [Orbilia oligospora]KAF3268656.1 hypothetical protein TWF128_007033 [Orbilia oligospora]KAF3297118.1 hypothetical protein TWF132_008476 [Orbilia oligospora]
MGMQIRIPPASCSLSSDLPNHRSAVPSASHRTDTAPLCQQNMQQIQHILHRKFTKSSTANMSSSSPKSTPIFSLPAELHFQILSYLPFTSHISLSSTHPFFGTLLQDQILRSSRYYSATYPGIHILLKDYTIRLIIRNNDVKNAKVEVLQLQKTRPTMRGSTKLVIVASLYFSTPHSPPSSPPLSPSSYRKDSNSNTKKGRINMTSILDDYWLWTPLKRNAPEIPPTNMDLKKLVVLLKINTPSIVPAKKDEDKRTYWSTEYPFCIARPTNATGSPSPPAPPPRTTTTTTNSKHKRQLSNPTPSPPLEPATLKQILTFISKRVIKEKGLKNEKKVKITLRVCKLGGSEGYVGFTGEVDVEDGGNTTGNFFTREVEVEAESEAEGAADERDGGPAAEAEVQTSTVQTRGSTSRWARWFGR